ncbi:MAG: hypothetical protein PHE32_00355 [Candidatus Shapirobacteria bacterium]|nr:hypothetical protein [Candidatus Shapirobacteria bacterium]MDD4410149.1 hypothetical protein [Candidatus Shapirobacteria bacterium]
MAHPERINEGETPYESGERYGCDLSYGDLNDLFLGLAEGLKDQAKGDEEKNKPKLANLGIKAVENIKKVTEIMVELKKANREELKETDINHKYLKEGTEISYLKYNSLESFLSGMVRIFEDQAEYSRCKENELLADLDKRVAKEIDELTDKVHDMWVISEPYMRVNTI